MHECTVGTVFLLSQVKDDVTGDVKKYKCQSLSLPPLSRRFPVPCSFQNHKQITSLTPSLTRSLSADSLVVCLPSKYDYVFPRLEFNSVSPLFGFVV